MNTLTEKDLKYYLGTGLKAISERTKEVRTVTIWHHTYDLKTVGINHLVCNGLMIERHIPLFLPISALTEHLPDGSIPIVELANIADFGEFEKFQYKETSTAYIVCMSDDCVFMILKKNLDIAVSVHKKPCFAPNQLQLFEYLYANHFWLGDQSYFDKGIIIDKRTVKID